MTVNTRIIEIVGLRAKAYSYLIDDDSKDKIAKGAKKCVIKRKHKFENYRICLKPNQLKNKINHLNKNKIDVNHEEFINKTMN